MIYEVFGRTDHDDPMQNLGSIRAESLDAAQSVAWQTFDGFRNVGMWLVPQGSIVRLDASSGAMDEGMLEAEAETLTNDPTDRTEIDA